VPLTVLGAALELTWCEEREAGRSEGQGTTDLPGQRPPEQGWYITGGSTTTWHIGGEN